MRRQRARRSLLVDPDVEWQRHGFEPRWVGMETSDCAAALEPNIFHGRGESELERFTASMRQPRYRFPRRGVSAAPGPSPLRRSAG
jgi:hypothetical protein